MSDASTCRVRAAHPGPVAELPFQFEFGQCVRILPPNPQAGAIGWVLSGMRWADGRETYNVFALGTILRLDSVLITYCDMGPGDDAPGGLD